MNDGVEQVSIASMIMHKFKQDANNMKFLAVLFKDC